MWRCITFLESFKRGKRILSREQTVVLLKKILGNLEGKIQNPISDKKESIGCFELEPVLNRQNLFKKIFVPSLASTSIDFNQHLAGMFFVEYDPLLDYAVINLCHEEKKIIKSAIVKEHEVEKIISSLSQKEEIQRIKEGDVIEIIEGDYKGIIGRIHRIEGEVCFINIQIFGCDKELSLYLDQVKITDDE
jgi:hypothetical protein